MRQIIFILLFFIGFSSFRWGEDKPNTYQSCDSIVTLLEKKINLENTENEKRDSINISLKSQLIIYKAKEDYFASALEDQSNRFSLIVAGLLTLFGFLSFSKYKNFTKETNIKMDSFRTEFDELKQESINLNSKLSKTAGNLYVLISKYFRSKKDYVRSMDYLLQAQKAIVAAIELDLGKDYTIVISNLTDAANDLTEIKKNPKSKATLANFKNKIFENLEIIHKAENDEVKNICAKIRVEILNYLDQD